MARSSGQKIKLLSILRCLWEETDEDHALTTKDLIDRLERLGISAERKSIYDDMEKLRELGYDVLVRDTRNGGGYYLASRDFELPELKLLVDAVQSSRFITEKKSRELIGKLEKLTSRYNGIHLQRQVFVAGRIKTQNESIYYHVDAIHRAIQNNCRIRFRYLDWNGQKKLVERQEGKIYVISPWSLLWKEENYYLAGYDSEADTIKHYRVDKMDGVSLLEKEREGKALFSAIDPAIYGNRSFGMFGGEIRQITLSFPESLVGVVIDRFGTDLFLQKTGEGMRARVEVAVSPPFFGWLVGIGSRIRIHSPESVAKEYADWLREILDQNKL